MKFAQFAAILVLALCAPAKSAITIPTVLVGNPGNPADTRYIDEFHPTGTGSVGYSFNIGRTEITNAQWVVFLNSVADADPYGLFNPFVCDAVLNCGITRSGSDGAFTYSVRQPELGGAYSFDDKPVVDITWGSMARFVNWLHNGQPTGNEDLSTTEDGAYFLNEATTENELLALSRKPGARWWIPSEDEWYKAAYHKNDGVTGNYWDYPTRTNSPPSNNVPASDVGNSANVYIQSYATGDPALPYTVGGAYAQSASPYGTFDQGGNVFDWLETTYYRPPDATHVVEQGRRIRGGAYNNGVDALLAENWTSNPTWAAGPIIGFRVATIAVPEPNPLVLIAIGLWAFGFRFAVLRSRPMTCDGDH